MKTKSQIVQELLNDGKINAEDAVILLTGNDKEKEYIFIPQNPYYPVYPSFPYNPPYYYVTNEFKVTSLN